SALAGPDSPTEAASAKPTPLRDRLSRVPENRRKAFLEALFREPERGHRARRPGGEEFASLAPRQWLRTLREAALAAWKPYLDGAAAVGRRPEFVDPTASGTGVLDVDIPPLDDAPARWTAAVAAALARHARADDVVVGWVAPAAPDGTRALPLRV